MTKPVSRRRRNNAFSKLDLTLVRRLVVKKSASEKRKKPLSVQMKKSGRLTHLHGTGR